MPSFTMSRSTSATAFGDDRVKRVAASTARSGEICLMVKVRLASLRSVSLSSSLVSTSLIEMGKIAMPWRSSSWISR